MIREQVVVGQVNITKAGQVNHFQMKLPQNAKRIIGVELGWRLHQIREVIAMRDNPKQYSDSMQVEVSAVHGNFFKRNILIGEVKLQSCEEANIFYAGHLQTDENMGLGDFSQNRNWMPSAFTHQMQSFEDVVIVDGESTMIQGIYKDRLGEQYKTNYNYLVNVYVWIEIEEPIIKQ